MPQCAHLPSSTELPGHTQALRPNRLHRPKSNSLRLPSNWGKTTTYRQKVNQTPSPAPQPGFNPNPSIGQGSLRTRGVGGSLWLPHGTSKNQGCMPTAPQESGRRSTQENHFANPSEPGMAKAKKGAVRWPSTCHLSVSAAFDASRDCNHWAWGDDSETTGMWVAVLQVDSLHGVSKCGGATNGGFPAGFPSTPQTKVPLKNMHTHLQEILSIPGQSQLPSLQKNRRGSPRKKSKRRCSFGGHSGCGRPGEPPRIGQGPSGL